MQIFSACVSDSEPPKHGEVLREDVDQTAVDAAVARDDAVAVDDLLVEPEVGGTVCDEPIELDERALVEEQVEPFACGELALVVLRLQALGAPALFRLGAALLEEVELVTHGHGAKR